jgi:hypothetical protein
MLRHVKQKAIRKPNPEDIVSKRSAEIFSVKKSQPKIFVVSNTKAKKLKVSSNFPNILKPIFPKSWGIPNA